MNEKPPKFPSFTLYGDEIDLKNLEKIEKWREDFKAWLHARFFHHCDVCYKPQNCVLGCKVTFSVEDLKEVLEAL